MDTPTEAERILDEAQSPLAALVHEVAEALALATSLFAAQQTLLDAIGDTVAHLDAYTHAVAKPAQAQPDVDEAAEATPDLESFPEADTDPTIPNR